MEEKQKEKYDPNKGDIIVFENPIIQIQNNQILLALLSIELFIIIQKKGVLALGETTITAN